ncbi:hypothetical protein GNIT_2947 [Glaciecola nitratireducens FR1064]|uniref:Uncharacterized protein n=1 Tax=Glaciecola nitratireducens (strain JCM 12485 / KCTC 12276 / FR1064) TaxID=1085623 RepID=G4QMW1_GLANF|nr:hypothetical protein GNIT_2947 [Glaciecola nitratireducens FR1064]
MDIRFLFCTFVIEMPFLFVFFFTFVSRIFDSFSFQAPNQSLISFSIQFTLFTIRPTGHLNRDTNDNI